MRTRRYRAPVRRRLSFVPLGVELLEGRAVASATAMQPLTNQLTNLGPDTPTTVTSVGSPISFSSGTVVSAPAGTLVTITSEGTSVVTAVPATVPPSWTIQISIPSGTAPDSTPLTQVTIETSRGITVLPPAPAAAATTPTVPPLPIAPPPPTAGGGGGAAAPLLTTTSDSSDLTPPPTQFSTTGSVASAAVGADGATVSATLPVASVPIKATAGRTATVTWNDGSTTPGTFQPDPTNPDRAVVQTTQTFNLKRANYVGLVTLGGPDAGPPALTYTVFVTFQPGAAPPPSGPTNLSPAFGTSPDVENTTPPNTPAPPNGSTPGAPNGITPVGPQIYLPKTPTQSQPQPAPSPTPSVLPTSVTASGSGTALAGLAASYQLDFKSAPPTPYDAGQRYGEPAAAVWLSAPATDPGPIMLTAAWSGRPATAIDLRDEAANRALVRSVGVVGGASDWASPGHLAERDDRVRVTVASTVRIAPAPVDLPPDRLPPVADDLVLLGAAVAGDPVLPQFSLQNAAGVLLLQQFAAGPLPDDVDVRPTARRERSSRSPLERVWPVGAGLTTIAVGIGVHILSLAGADAEPDLVSELDIVTAAEPVSVSGGTSARDGASFRKMAARMLAAGVAALARVGRGARL